MVCRRLIVPFAFGLLGCLAAAPAARADLLSQSARDRLSAQRYWRLDLTLNPGESIARSVLLDDNLYLLTNENRVLTIHAPTGIMRWARRLAEPGETIRGPSHNADHVFFTTGGTVLVFNRRSGAPAGEVRALRGVVIEAQHDWATISIGQDHGVRLEDTFDVNRVNEFGEVVERSIARLEIKSLRARTARGRLTKRNSTNRVRSGDRVSADTILPVEEIKLPFAASSPAVADKRRIFVGAANQRFYSLDILTGITYWQLMTPETVSAAPVLAGGNLFFAGLDGRVVACTKDDRRKQWVFQAEGPVFADPLVEADRVFIAASDRSLYCLNRVTGERIWRHRFDTPLVEAPTVSTGRVYQPVPGQGLRILDGQTGQVLWRRPDGVRFLVEYDGDAIILIGDGTRRILRADAATGRTKDIVAAMDVRFAVADGNDRSIILAADDGRLECLRAKSAPRLKPEQLAEALVDPKAGKLAGHTVERKTPETPVKESRHDGDSRLLERLFEDDWLASRNTARPAGGRGLVEVAGQGDQATEAAKPGVDEEVSEDQPADAEGDTGDESGDGEADEETDAEDDDWEDDDWEDEDSDDDAEGGTDGEDDDAEDEEDDGF